MQRVMTSFAGVACLAVLVPLASLPAFAQEFLVIGDEFQVNTHTVNYQNAGAVGVDADGDFVVVWQSTLQDGSGNGVFAQRFNSAGGRRGIEFQVNASTANSEGQPDLAVSDGGSFVVAWRVGMYSAPVTPRGVPAVRDVLVRRFDAAGVPLGVELQVETYDGNQSAPAVSIDRDGGSFVVAWATDGQDGDGHGIFARRFDSSGTPQGLEFQVSTFTAGAQQYPAVAMSRTGSFVVAWESQQQDGFNGGVFAQRFDSSGARLGGELQVNLYTPYGQNRPSIGLADDGDFVVAWFSGNQELSYYGVFGRRFNSAGVAQGAEFQINTYTPGTQVEPQLAMSAGGDFIVAWASHMSQDGSSGGGFARRFDSAGGALANEFQVNSFTPGQQVQQVIATNGGDVVVAWTSAFQDGSSAGVFAQRYRSLAVYDVDGNGSTDPLTDGLLVLRFLFGFKGAVLVNGAVDLSGCTRCDAAAIEAYLEPLG